MGNKATEPTSQERKPEQVKARISAPPRLNVALSLLDTMRVLPAFFGEAIGAFHLSLSSARAGRHPGAGPHDLRKSPGLRKERGRVLRAPRFNHAMQRE